MFVSFIFSPSPMALLCRQRSMIFCKMFQANQQTYPTFFFFFNGCTHGIWKFPGQGLNLSCIWNYLISLSRAAAGGFLTYCATVGTPILFNFDKQTATFSESLSLSLADSSSSLGYFQGCGQISWNPVPALLLLNPSWPCLEDWK